MKGQQEAAGGGKATKEAAKGEKAAEGRKLMAQGTGLCDAVSCMREWCVRVSAEGQLYAYKTVSEVRQHQYAWFEHVGDGLWVRIIVLFDGGSGVPRRRRRTTNSSVRRTMRSRKSISSTSRSRTPYCRWPVGPAGIGSSSVSTACETAAPCRAEDGVSSCSIGPSVWRYLASSGLP